MDDGDFEGMVEKLVELCTANSAMVRVMMTSRPLPHIEQALNHPEVARLRLDPALLSPDVARYVDARMLTLDPPLSDDKNELVKHTICERANGLFLQARLMADNLAEGLRDGRITEETLPDSLDRLPRTLRAVYEDMLKEHARRSGVTSEQQAKILMCVTHSNRPLRLIELGSLLSRMLHVDLRRGKDLVRASCGRLLELLEDETVSVIHHSFTEFLHDVSRKDDDGAFPVLEDEASHAMLAVLLLEYLDGCPHLDTTIDDRREANYQEPDFSVEEEKRRDKIRTDTRLNQPLASYAVDNLFWHIAKVPAGTSANQLLDALDRCLVAGKPAFETWLLMKWDDRLTTSFNIFHLITAVYDGQLSPVYVLEHFADKEPALLDRPDSYGMTPLAYAAQEDLVDVARALLAKGADPISGAKDGLTPFHRAISKKNMEIVQHFLEAGVDPLTKTWPVRSEYNRYEDYDEEYSEAEAERRRETALAYAFRSDDEGLVKAFMPFLPPDEVNKCLHRVKSAKNVKAVLDTGKADVDCFCGKMTKLYGAAQKRDVEVIKLLLEHGADPNKRCIRDRWRTHDGSITMELPRPDCERGPTPLHAFAGLRDERRTLFEGEKENAAECLRVLVQAGADVNATMDVEDYIGQNLTPLHLAVQRTNNEIIYWGAYDHSEEILTEVLLAAGADPSAKTTNGNTPLHLANPEKSCLLELLVKNGADINASNVWGRTPLLEVITRLNYPDQVKPNVELFSRLLELGADVHVVDKNGDSVFHHVLYNFSKFTDPEFAPVFKNLVRAGADLNWRNKKGQPPLWKYNGGSSSFHVNNDADEAILRVLIDAGMDLNARDGEGRTVLWEIIGRYGIETSTVDKFIRLGADPGALTHDGRTLLHATLKRSNSAEWFRYLISVGSRPDALDKNGNTIIHALLRGPHQSSALREVLEVLVEAGALPLARNAKGQSALHVVGDLDKLDMVLATPMFKGLDVNELDVDGFAPLHHAVKLGEVAVSKLVRAGADPTVLVPGGLSPLHVAARRGEANVVGLLLAQYGELNVLEKHVNLLGKGRPPLHYACQSGSPEAVWILLRNGAEPKMTDEKGLTPLHALAEFEDEKKIQTIEAWPRAGDIVGMLQRAGADLNAVALVQGEDEATSRSLTPLDMAVEKGCFEMVRQLIAHGVEPNDGSKDFVLATDKEKAAEAARKAQADLQRSQQSSSPGRGGGGHRRWRGRWAACPGAKEPLEETRYFIGGGQDILDITAEACQDGNNEDKRGKATYILSRVLQDGDYDTIKEYAQLGGDLLELDNQRDHTFLHHLAEQGRAELLEYFGDKVFELEAQEWPQHDEASCATLLGTVCYHRQPSLHIVHLLVDKLGVDVNAIYRPHHYSWKQRGGTALHVLASGAYFWQIEALEYLLSKGADTETRSGKGMTPLLAAIDREHPDGFWREETIRVLLRHGADVNATVQGEGAPSRGPSALEMSSQPGVTKILLEHGASVKSCPGILARVVKEWMEPGVVKLLLDAGVDPNELPSLQEEKEEDENQSEEEGEKDENGDEGEEEDDDEKDDNEDDECAEKPKINPRHVLHEAARFPIQEYTPFDLKTRQLAVIDLLVSHGANAYAPYLDGSFVFQAIVEDRGEVQSLLPKITQTNCNLRGHHGRTLLASACMPVVPVGHDTSYRGLPPKFTVMVDVIHALLNVKADPLAADDERRTPLHWFCTYPGEFDEGCRNAFVALARHGPDAVQTTDKQGRKPLHHALATYASRAQSSPFAIQHLLSLGADPADPDPVTGNSVLHFIGPRLIGESAAAATATALFRELSTRVDINSRNANDEPPVFAFAVAQWESVREPPRTRGTPATTTFTTPPDDTKHAEALDVFTSLGADLTAVDNRKRTLLHVTAGREKTFESKRSGRLEVWDQKEDVEAVFKRLMDLGVDPRGEDDELRTAIDVAVARGWSGIVNLFSEEGRRMRAEEEKKKEEEKKEREETNEESESESERGSESESECESEEEGDGFDLV